VTNETGCKLQQHSQTVHTRQSDVKEKVQMSKLTSKGLVPTTVLVIPADWKQFQKLAIETGTSGSALVRGFIRSTVLKAAKEAVQVAPVKAAQRSSRAEKAAAK
jgi:hypothetical protein